MSSYNGDSGTLDSSEEVRNWLELPRDVTCIIFMKLGAIDILFSVQSVCCAWRQLAREPELYRSIDIRKPKDLLLLDEDEYDVEKIIREAVDRSCGQLVEFSVEHFGTNELLQFITDKSSPLKCLRIVSCYGVRDETLIETAKAVPLLEELELSHCSFSKEVIETFGMLCLQLKSFRLNYRGYRRPHIECNEEALAISQTMPELRHLHLFGNKLTDDGLRAILDGCPHLKFIDLRQCFNIHMEAELRKKCVDRLIKVRLPDDPTDDYEYDAEIEAYGSSDEGYPSGFSEIDFLSDEAYYEFSEGSYYSDYDDFGF